MNLAAVGKRFLIVVPSQTLGMLLPYGLGSYVPSPVEVRIILGLIGLGTLLYAVFAKVFPIMEVEAPDEAIPWQARMVFSMPSRRALSPRTVVAIAMVVAGFAIQALAYFLNSSQNPASGWSILGLWTTCLGGEDRWGFRS